MAFQLCSECNTCKTKINCHAFRPEETLNHMFVEDAVQAVKAFQASGARLGGKDWSFTFVERRISWQSLNWVKTCGPVGHHTVDGRNLAPPGMYKTL